MKKSNISIIEFFRKNLFASMSIRALSLKLKKSYTLTYHAVQELSKKKVLNIKTVGKSKICEISFSPEAISLLAFLEEQEALASIIPPLQKIMNFKEFSDDVIVVIGSYAKGTQTGKSDIDLVIITKDDAFKKQKLIENLTAIMLPRIHAIVITPQDFISMLLDKKATFGKEVFKHHLVYSNAGKYYTLVKEAVEHGFRG